MRRFSIKTIFIIILVTAIIILSILFLLSSSKQKNQPGIQKVIIFSPPPTVTPSITPTGSYNQLTQQQKNDYQIQSDQNIQNIQNKILQQYPWYPRLPLQSTNYFVYFDPPSETFIVKLYPQKNSATPIDNQVSNLKTAVIQRINTLGSNAGKYKIDWRVTPE